MYENFYRIHLVNGQIIEYGEDYSLGDREGITARFRRARERDCIYAGDCIKGYLYIPKRSVLYIEQVKNPNA